MVTKAPRFNFEKFPEADAVLTTQMRSVGEGMAIGRTFRESFQKALRSLETGRFGFGMDRKQADDAVPVGRRPQAPAQATRPQPDVPGPRGVSARAGAWRSSPS